MKTVLYYFTATGNSLDIAKDIATELGETEIISIPQLYNNKKIVPSGERLGIIFPVYDWGAPEFICDFIKKIDLTNINYIFAITHCNYIPGMALDQINDELKLKSKELSAGFIIKMPGNYLPLYGASSIEKQEKKLREKGNSIKKIVAVVNNNKKVPLEKSRLIFDRLLAPKMHKATKDFAQKDSNFKITSKCNGCSICKKVCAFGNIEIIGNKPQWQHKCQQCMACIQLCPNEAIQYGDKTEQRKRYKNPHVTLQDIIKSNQI